MGKSPGKWIKTLLFGKKSSRSSAGKGREALRPVNDKEAWVATKDLPAEFAANPPMISLPIAAANTDKNGGNSELEKGVPSNLPSDGGVLPPVSLAAESQGSGGSIASNNPERFREEQAAVKAQAAFRGYLARRAFRALRGIIRLQALVRGHLVRRQAVATLHSLQGIVKLQALVRGRRVRHSDLGLEVYKICILEKGAKPFGWLARKDKLSTNAFFFKLLASSPTALPLRMRYAQGEPNSAWNWLERWTISHFWEPVSLPKKVAVDSKVHTKKATAHSAETAESGRPKRSVRRNTSVNTDSSSLTHPTSEIEKPKRNLRKMSTAPVVDPVQEHPTNELEKVKRSLRKVATSTAEASSDQTDLEPEKPKRSFKKVSSSPSDVPDQIVGDSSEKMKKDTSASLVIPFDIETATLKPVTIDGPVDVLQADQLAVELLPLDISGNDGNVSVTNGKISSKDDQICLENQKSSKRRVSLPAKGDENGLPNAPTLPSYMAATESAKAKLRAQGSPRFGSEAIEKNGITRRHSLPNSANGKVSSPSVRAQKLVQVGGKGGSKNDRSMLASRDGNEKVITEWRR